MASIKGKWVWNDVVYCQWLIAHPGSYDISFVSNGERFSGIGTNWMTGYHTLYYFNENTYVPVGESKAVNEDFYTVDKAYRIMNFGEEQLVDDVLHEFIIQNAHEITMSEKYEYIANNEKKVFDAGHYQGHLEGRSEGYNIGYDDGYKQGLDTGGYNKGYEAGKQNEHDAFWDAYLPEKLANWQYIYYSQRWNDTNFYPHRDMKVRGSLVFGFSSHHISNLKQRLIDCGVTLDTSGATEGGYWFAFCPYITNIPTISFVGLTTEIYSVFDNCPKLKEIEKIILKEDGSTTFGNWFRRLLELENITFEGVIGNHIDFSSSTKLSKVSITNIINHLSDTASGKTLTLSKVAVENAFVYGVDPDGDGEYDWTFDEGTWDGLVATKPNWQISLV